jgi:hypothetical protein
MIYYINMIKLPAEIFSPTEIWTPDAEGFELEEYILEAIDYINSEDPRALIRNLKQKVTNSQNGVKLAVLDGDKPEEYSQTDGLVLINPHANTGTPNMLVRAEFIRRVAQKADIRDAEGKLKPVIMVVAAGLHGSKAKFTAEERREIRNGEFGPVAREYLQAVSERGVGSVALAGASEGGDLVLAGARSANRANLDVSSMAVADPAGVEDRHWIKLGLEFMSAGPSLQHSIEAGGIKVQSVAIGAKPWSLNRNKDFVRFGFDAVLDRTNRDLWRGMAHSRFEAQMQEILAEGIMDRLVIGYGDEEDKITKPRAIEPAIENLYEVFGTDSFTSIKIAKGAHSWGDRLPVLAKLYIRSLV